MYFSLELSARHILKNVWLDFRRSSGCYQRRDILRKLRDGPNNIFLAVTALGNSPTRLEVHGAVHRQVDIALFKEDHR